MEYKAYAANGDKNTPEEMIETMTKLAKELDDMGFTLRTNGGLVVGTTFENASTRKEIYLPWKKFNDKVGYMHKVSPAAIELAIRFFSKLADMKDYMKNIVGSNSHMMLGENLRDPVKFLVVWTPDGVEDGTKVTAKTGYTSNCIKIATASKIPVFNLQNGGAYNRIIEFAKTIKGTDILF